MNRALKLPEELREENYYYPPALFNDHKNKYLRFDGSDKIPAPITKSERPVLMARYAVAKAIDNFSDARSAKIARGEIEVGLLASIKKVWHQKHHSYGGLEDGDIELLAEELEVYEIIWPFDPQKMEDALEAEQQLENRPLVKA